MHAIDIAPSSFFCQFGERCLQDTRNTVFDDVWDAVRHVLAPWFGQRGKQVGDTEVRLAEQQRAEAA